MSKSNYAPIALFTYNRPHHTRQAVEALQGNSLWRESSLYIFSDGPKGENDEPLVSQVRDYIYGIEGFKSVSITENTDNLGLGNSLIAGISSVLEEHGNVIVLEDDIVANPNFLTFMNEALDTHSSSEEIMHISGYMYPVESEDLPDTFLLPIASCWGWGTWRRAWQHFEKKPERLVSSMNEEDIFRFNLDGTYDFWSQVEGNINGSMNTWAVFWYASIFKRNGHCLHPAQSMVENIGQDGSGTHSPLIKQPNATANRSRKISVDPSPRNNLTALARVQEHLQYPGKVRLSSRMVKKAKQLVSAVARRSLKKFFCA